MDRLPRPLRSGADTALLRHHTPQRRRLESLRSASLRHKMPAYQVTVQYTAARCPEERQTLTKKSRFLRRSFYFR